MIDISTFIPNASSSFLRRPLKPASPACILPVLIAFNIVRSLAESGLGVPNLDVINLSNSSADTRIPKSISEFSLAVPAARLPWTKISSLTSPNLSLIKSDDSMNCSVVSPWGNLAL